MQKSRNKYKMKQFRKLKSAYGITLITLVITIILLLILAGIIINLSLGENGIFNKAKYAKIEYEKAKIKEELELEIVDAKDTIVSTVENNKIAVAKYVANQI
ncbi:MAG: hypothetical protein HFJ42_03900 [Clostridia bacterium]|nr:hypothetical protein [Clostridia bacterium]